MRGETSGLPACSLGLDSFADPGDFVAAEIVGSDDVAHGQRRSQELLDIGAEAAAIDGAAEHQGCHDPVMPQPGQKGAGIPMAEWRLCDQAFTSPAPATWR